MNRLAADDRLALPAPVVEALADGHESDRSSIAGGDLEDGGAEVHPDAPPADVAEPTVGADVAAHESIGVEGVPEEILGMKVVSIPGRSTSSMGCTP